MTQIDQDAILILGLLANAPRNQYLDAVEIQKALDLTPDRINDAMALLVDAGYAQWIQTLGSAPFDFAAAIITSRGRYERQRLESEGQRPDALATAPAAPQQVLRPPSPIGSPYGFTDEDWEIVAARKHEPWKLYTVLGHQFESEHYGTEDLRINVETMLHGALDKFNVVQPQDEPILLDHRNLAAGYGEHLFNEIARDIIGADIAVFETSDLNPNVMVEMGVALTWGVRVLPIKLQGRSRPPSDISGQTWADYMDSAKTFVDPEHEAKLLRMVERAIQKKNRGPQR